MEKKCQIDGNVMKLVPAGVSKRTGKPYKAFYSCKDGHTAPAAVAPSNTPVSPVKTQNNEITEVLVALKRIEKKLDSVLDVPKTGTASPILGVAAYYTGAAQYGETHVADARPEPSPAPDEREYNF